MVLADDHWLVLRWRAPGQATSAAPFVRIFSRPAARLDTALADLLMHVGTNAVGWIAAGLRAGSTAGLRRTGTDAR